MKIVCSKRGIPVATMSVLILTGASAPTYAQESPPRDASQLEEIIVTAQKRQERLLEVPSSISVLTSDSLTSMGATQLTDYASYVPGLQVTTGGAPGQAQIAIRGVRAQGGGSTVGTYIDDAPLGASNAYARANIFQLDLFPYDIERIEVLRGPQGTLYGASTNGGLLKYVTLRPNLNDFEARAGGDLSGMANSGDTGWGARAGANVPIVKGKLALRGSYFKEHTPGFIDNVATHKNDENYATQDGGRLSLLWKPTDAISINLFGMTETNRAGALSAVDVLKTATAGSTYGTPQFGDLTRSHPVPEPYYQRVKFYGGTVNADLGFADFTSATSRSETRTTQVSDITFAFGPLLPLLGYAPSSYADFGLLLKVDKWTQEFRLASPSGGSFEWLVGAFYTYEKILNLQTGDALSPSIQVLGRFTTVTGDSSYEEKAAFGNLTYKFNDKFDITAGLRYAANDQKINQTQVGSLGNSAFYGNSDEGVLTYLANLRFHPSEDTMIYGRIASGYRPGGPNGIIPGAPQVPPSFNSDTLVNYEVGIKSELAEKRAVVEAALFYIDWNNFQTVQIFTTPVGGFGATVNAGGAVSKGVEVSTSLTPVKGLTIGANVTYTIAELSQNAITQLGPVGVKGAPLDLTPKWSGALTVDYSKPLWGNWIGRIGGGYRYIGDRVGMFPRPGTPGQPVIRDQFGNYQVVDLHAGLSIDKVSFQLFAKNLFDKRAYLNGTGLGNYYTVIQPRTVGMSVDLRY